MAHLDDFIKGIINGEIPTPSANAAEIQTLIDTIGAEEDAVKGEYSKIGELYYKLHSDRTDGELGALVKGVNGSKKKILDSKMRIGALLDLTFCEACGEQVDEDALFCNNCGAKMPVKVLPGMVLCKHCNKAVREGIKFCTNCGHSMIEEVKPKALKECANCGFPIEEEKEVVKEPTRKVCTNCGFSIFDAETMFCNDCGRRLVEESELNK